MVQIFISQLNKFTAKIKDKEGKECLLEFNKTPESWESKKIHGEIDVSYKFSGHYSMPFIVDSLSRIHGYAVLDSIKGHPPLDVDIHNDKERWKKL